MGLDLARQRQHKSAKRGDLAGPNPTDRAKLGTKRHVLTDGQGIPLGVTLTGANVHNKHVCGKTLDAVVLKGSRGPRRPKNLCLDKGYTSNPSRKRAPAESNRISDAEGEPPKGGRARPSPLTASRA